MAAGSVVAGKEVTTLEQRDSAASKFFINKGGRGEMTKTPIGLQDLRRRIYLKAKTDKGHRFWGLYVHTVKMDTLREAYRLAKRNNGAPGIDGMTFEAIEQAGVEDFLNKLHEEMVNETYLPLRSRKKEIPKDGSNKTRTLSIPTIRDRVVQGALKLILEPILEADFQEGSYGYRPKRQAHEATERVAKAIVRQHTTVIDIDLKDFFGSVKHHILLEKVAERVNDEKFMRLIKLILKSTGKKGLPQGGPLSPLISNLYLNEVDKMLECVLRRLWRGITIQFGEVIPLQFGEV